MDSHQINLKAGKLFPFQFQLLAFIFLLLGVALLLVHVIPAIILLFLGGMMVTGFSGCQFDLQNKKYRNYQSFFWLRLGKWQEIKTIEKVYINKIKTSQRIYSRANMSTTVKGYVFKAFIKFSNGEKMMILESPDKNYVVEAIRPLAASHKLQIDDNST